MDKKRKTTNNNNNNKSEDPSMRDYKLELEKLQLKRLKFWHQVNMDTGNRKNSEWMIDALRYQYNVTGRKLVREKNDDEKKDVADEEEMQAFIDGNDGVLY
jgi:hypothetical protein